MHPSTPVLRLAESEEDRAAVYRLRYELYVEGQGLFYDEADHARRWLRDDYDAHSHLILAEHDGVCLGTSRMTFGSEATFSATSRADYDFGRFTDLVGEADLSVITRLLVHPTHRGGDLGTRLFAASFALAARRGAELVLGTCELHFVNHYWKLGFRPFGALSNHPTNGALVRIALVTGDLEHLERIDSPMVGALATRTRSRGAVPGLLARLDDDPTLTSEARVGAARYRRAVAAQWGDAVGLEDRLGLNRDDTARLLHRSHLLRCAAGDALFRDGHASRIVYILLSGSLDVRDPATGMARVERPGALVGATALLGAGRRLGDVAAGARGAVVLALDDRTLRGILAERDQLAADFLIFAARELCQKRVDRAASLPRHGPQPAPPSRHARRMRRRVPCRHRHPNRTRHRRHRPTQHRHPALA